MANIVFTDYEFAVIDGLTDRTDPARWADYVNVLEFGVVQGGVAAANTLGLQAAIDYAYSSGKRGISLPPGKDNAGGGFYNYVPPLFLDPPGNLRGGGLTYSAGTTYARNDTVISVGVKYVSLQNTNLNHTPAATLGTWWRLFSWAVGTTYAAGDVTSYNGAPWASIAGGHLGNVPSITSTFWQATVVTPTNFGWSLGLYGSGLAKSFGWGTALRPTSDNAPALWVGTGEGMVVYGVTISGPQSGQPGSTLNVNGIGLAIAGGNGGATNVWIDQLYAYNFYTAFKTGANEVNSLADNITFNKCSSSHCYYGLDIGHQQNYLIMLISCHMQGNYPIYNTKPVNVTLLGGSAGGTGNEIGVYTISAVSTLTDTGDGSYTFTVHIDNPDSNLDYDVLIFNLGVISTTNFGQIPLLVDDYDGGTQVMTFRIRDSWRKSQYANLNIITGTAIETDIQACTTAWVAEENVLYTGNVHVIGTHVETPLPFCMYQTGTVSSNPVVFDQIQFNGSTGGAEYAVYLGSGSATEGRFRLQQAHPWLDLFNAQFTIKDSNFTDGLTGDFATIDAKPQRDNYYFERNINLWSPNIRYWTFNTNTPSANSSRYKGTGIYSTMPFLFPANEGGNETDQMMIASDAQAPAFGYRPSPYIQPSLTSDQYALVSGVLAPGDLGDYACINGKTIYQVQEDSKLVQSTHSFASLGQDLDYDWIYKGASNCVRIGQAVTGAANNGAGLIRLTVGSTSFFTTGDGVPVSGVGGVTAANGYWTVTVIDATHLDLVGSTFAGVYTSGGLVGNVAWIKSGQKIILNFNAIDNPFVVTGVFKSLGYVTITTVDDGTSVVFNAGTKTVTYTGTSVKQEVYTFVESVLS